MVRVNCARLIWRDYYKMARRRRQVREEGAMSEEGNPEAEEDREALEDAELHEESIHEGDSEDLEANADQDYQEIPALDQYQGEGIDDQEVEDSEGARARAEEELMRREGGRGLGYDFLEEEGRRQMEEEEQEDEEGKLSKYLDYENAKGRLPDWIEEPQTTLFVRVMFNRFLSNFREEASGRAIYADAFVDMCARNQQSLEISLEHLASFQPTIGYWVGYYPGLMIPKLHEALYRRACKHFRSYGSVHHEAFVRFKDSMMTDELRKLRYKDVGKLIYLKGVITYRSSILSQMREVYFRCRRPDCGNLKGPFLITDISEFNHGKCLQCQSKSFKLQSSKVLYRNYQTLLMQEKPQNVEPGRIPRHKEVVVSGDLADRVKPGDEVQLVGTFSSRYSFMLSAAINYPVLYTFIECNNIYAHQDSKQLMTVTGSRQAHEISKRPDLVELLCNSAFPSIFGHNMVKLSLLLSLFGGVEVDTSDHRIRGDINVLLVGDPGTAKSQMLKSIQAVAPKAIYTTGKGASAVGLTASVRMNSSTQEWGIEAGALVLSDKGTCIIDEFDKMTEYDRSAIHEAMEQQSISIAKAGLCTRLNARCSVVAAANPVKGRYDRQLTFKENVDLSDPILSRFDILCVIEDTADESVDSRMGTFVINSHIRNHPINAKLRARQGQQEFDEYFKENSLELSEPVKETLPLNVMRGYINYAREKVRPRLKESQKEKLSKFYVALRRESAGSTGINIVVRHVESMIRMSEAHAKMHLRNQVLDSDIDMAMHIMLESFTQTQRPSVVKAIKRSLRTLIS